MYKLGNKIQELMSPTDAGSAAGSASPLGGEMSKEDMIEFMNKDDEPEPIELDDKKAKPKDEPADKKVKASGDELQEKDEEAEEEDDDEEEESEDDDLEELEEDLEEPDERKLELVTPVRRKEILKAYPDLFKKFPYLEKAYYREQQFTEVFPTIDDAKEARQAADTLVRMEADLMDGNSELVFNAIKTQDQNSFNQLIDNFLPTLAKVDEKAYFNLIGNIVKLTISQMASKSRELGEKDGQSLMDAATMVNQFIFGTNKYEPPKNLAAEKSGNKEESKLTQERNEFNRQRFEVSRNEVNTKVNNSIKATIEANIDPKKSMSDYIKKNAIKDAQKDIGEQIMKDTLNRLWITSERLLTLVPKHCCFQ